MSLFLVVANETLRRTVFVAFLTGAATAIANKLVDVAAEKLREQNEPEAPK